MIEKDYRKKKESTYYKTNNNWILSLCNIRNDIQLKMKSNFRTEDEIILLINPLTMKRETHLYGLNEKEKFGDNEPLTFVLESEKGINPKLEKKNKKGLKDDDKTKDTENVKSKLKLKRKIEGSFDDKGGRNTQNLNKGKKRKKGSKKKDSENDSVMVQPEEIFLSGPISVQELGENICVSATEIIKILFLDGIIVNLNQILDPDTAINVGEKLGTKIIFSENELKSERKDFSKLSDLENAEKRPPIIAVMGHVDHGKTTLLDKIRQTQVAQKEAGGITQKIGAYEVNINYRDEEKRLVFLDTPGHEAFASMRYRGVQVTDIAVLVVAADDGIKPQTVETIKCIKEAKVPLIVAINKIDKDDANIEVIKQELSKYDVIPDEWGGDTPMVPISAKEGTNMDELLEMMVILSDMLDLRASNAGNAEGTILEANLDKAKGAIATLLVQNGVLEVGDIIVTNSSMSKIRGMINSNNEPIMKSIPSSPVLVWGLSEVPSIGDKFEAFKEEKEAKAALQVRKEETSSLQNSSSTADKYSLLNSNIQGVINLVIKTDIQGSVEAIINSINQIDQDKVKIRVLYASPGEITGTDVDFADASKSTILAFNTNLAPGAKKAARHLGVTIKEYNVIYDLFDDIQIMVDDIIGPQYEERSIGQAMVKAVFPLGKKYVAGSLVTEGKIIKGCHVKVNRDGVEVYQGVLSSLKQFKQDVGEMEENSECGIYIDEFDEWREKDIILAFELVEKKRNK